VKNSFDLLLLDHSLEVLIQYCRPTHGAKRALITANY